MNRRRTVTPHLSFGNVVFLIAAALVMASAGVFHAYIKNRQINVSREIQAVEDQISQRKLEIATYEMLLGDELNRFVLGARLKDISSDLRSIPVSVVTEIPVQPLRSAVAEAVTESPPGSPSSTVADPVRERTPPAGSAVAGGP